MGRAGVAGKGLLELTDLPLFAPLLLEAVAEEHAALQHLHDFPLFLFAKNLESGHVCTSNMLLRQKRIVDEPDLIEDRKSVV